MCECTKLWPSSQMPERHVLPSFKSQQHTPSTTSYEVPLNKATISLLPIQNSIKSLM